MSDITTDFIKATNKIYAKVGAILTNLNIIESDVKLIREKVVDNSDRPSSDTQTNNAKKQSSPSVPALDATQAKRQEEKGRDEQQGSLSRLLNRWWEQIQKPKFQVSVLTLAFLIAYTCETRKANKLTERAVNLQFSLSRAFVQITGTAASKSTLDDIQKAGDIPLELQNVGKSTASKVHGAFVIELPLAQQEPSFNLKNNPTTVTHSPLYPGAPSDTIGLIFVAEYGTVPQIPPQVIRDLIGGTRYMVIFGRVEYADSFGQWWTQFCGWRHFVPTANPPQLLGFAASRCIDYNIEGSTPKQKQP